MKIAKIEMTADKLLLAISAAIAVMLLLAYIIFFAPLISQVKKKAFEYKSLEDQLATARDMVKYSGSAGDRVLITETQSSVAIDELTKHGQSKGINFISIKPAEPVTEPGSQYKILPIEMEIEGADRQISDFLGSLDELQKTVITVKGFNITTKKDNVSILNAKVTVNMYLSRFENAE